MGNGASVLNNSLRVGMERRLLVVGRDPGLPFSALHLQLLSDLIRSFGKTEMSGNEGTASGYISLLPSFPVPSNPVIPPGVVCGRIKITWPQEKAVTARVSWLAWALLPDLPGCNP